MTAHKTDSHAKQGYRRVHPLKDEAIFDLELQRYVMPSERHATMTKQDNGK
jgi:hypothetical protein